MRNLQRVAFVLVIQLVQICTRHKIKWRRLFLVGAFMTTIVFVLHNRTPPNYRLLLPSTDAVSSGHRLNSSLHITQVLNEIKVEQFESVPAAVVTVDSSSEILTVENLDGTARQVKRRRWKKRRANEELIAVDSPPPPPHIPTLFESYIWSLSPDKALSYAKEEIENAPVVTDDPDLYEPVFQNLSVFKRSYELMELILKVYVYPDGERPIFHHPHLTGIYASEGWFMRLMKGNMQFEVRNPEKAHLFYMPYSARQLQQALYVPGSHDIKPLSIFLRDYVNMIAEKYPFWNRTHGSDHFLVACHDWGPYTLNEHQELNKKAIKALCNADLSDRIFLPGKDVSLPEITIKNPFKTLRFIGKGNKVAQRSILAFFAGKMHGRVRPRLIKYWRDKDEDMKIYHDLPNSVARNMSYIQHMKTSKYCLCPMGYEVNSPRIVEAIYYECVPVIIADNFVLPFSEVLNWSAFSVVVAEKDIRRLKEILLSIPLERYLKMQTNVKMVQKHFFWNRTPMRYDVFHMILHSIWFNRLNQIQVPNSE